jgi:hypothetical protein
MAVPVWYDTYLMLHKARVCPFNELSSVPSQSDVWGVNGIFITPPYDGPPANLDAFSLLPSIWDRVLTAPSAPLTPEEVQATLLASQSQKKPPEFIPAVSIQQGSFEGSVRLKQYGPAPQQQQQQEIDTDTDIDENTRRIASKLHIMASRKQLDPAVRGIHFIFGFSRALYFYLAMFSFLCRKYLMMKLVLLSNFS